MSVDFPRAWEIARATEFQKHHPKCSYRTERGGFLCDCEVLTEHPEYKDDVLQGAGGFPCRREKALECGMSSEKIETWLCPDCKRVTCDCPGVPRTDKRCLGCGVHYNIDKRKVEKALEAE